MIGLLLLFFIGKAFFTLAEKHKRNKWVFAVLGVAVYYGSAFLGGILLGFIAIAMDYEQIFLLSDFELGLIAMPFALLSVVLTYYILKRTWERNPKDEDLELLDSAGMNLKDDIPQIEEE